MADNTWGLIDWLRGAAAGALLSLRADTTPSPTHRPRVSKWGTYYAKSYQTYHADCVKQFSQVIAQPRRVLTMDEHAKVSVLQSEARELRARLAVIGEHISAISDNTYIDLDGPLLCVVETVCARPKTTKLKVPRGDSDNYAKAPLDAATKAGVWGDDAQVVPVASTRRWAEPGEHPGVNLHIARLETQ